MSKSPGATGGSVFPSVSGLPVLLDRPGEGVPCGQSGPPPGAWRAHILPVTPRSPVEGTGCHLERKEMGEVQTEVSGTGCGLDSTHPVSGAPRPGEDGVRQAVSTWGDAGQGCLWAECAGDAGFQVELRKLLGEVRAACRCIYSREGVGSPISATCPRKKTHD